MTMKTIIQIKHAMPALLALLCLMAIETVSAQRLQQRTGRGVVAVRRGGTDRTGDGGSGSLISWRKLAEEPEGTTYNVYRRAAGSTDYTKVNRTPLKVTCLSTTLANNNEYAVTAITPDGVEGEMSAPFLYKTQTWDNVWFKFDFDNTVLSRNDYRTKYVWPMDLDGDGDVDALVTDRLFAGAAETEESENMEDNTATTTHKLQAYRLDGTLLWTVDMGPNVNICAGQNDMVLAYDINCDGRCEVIIRSSDGTRFWDKQNETWGKYVGGSTTPDIDKDGITDYRTQSRRNPPFYISVIDGATGEELTYTELNYAELSEGSGGDNYRRDNRADYRSFGYGAMEGHYGIAYLDGIHPSLIMECEDRDTGGAHHGYILTFDYTWAAGQPANWHHSHTWVRNPIRPWCAEFHQIRILDSDGDGCDEMWAGGYGVNPAQNRYTSTGLEHGDRFVISDIDPDRPGMEGFAIQQSALLGQCLYDARTGERIKEWYLPGVYDVGRGTAMDVDASHKGYEIYSYVDEFYYDCKGDKTTNTRSGSIYEGIWWNGDLLREELNSPGGSGWGTNLMITTVLGKARLAEFSRESGWATMGGTGTRPAFMGDITGDWREELILANQNADSSTGLVGYTTAMTTNYSIYCLQQDPHYRLDCTTRGYYQHPNTGFYLGGGMPMPPLPPVLTADLRWQGSGIFTDYAMTQNACFSNGKSILFDISGDNSTAIELAPAINPSQIILMNPRGHDYAFTGDGTTGEGSLIKSQLGSVTFDANLGHTGANIISEGTLAVNGTIAGPVELRARGTLSGNAVLLDTVTFEGALNYEGCRLMPAGADGVICSKRSMVLPGNVYIEVDAANGKCGRISVEGDLTFRLQNTISMNHDELAAGTYTIAECTGTLTVDVTKLKTRGLDGVNFDFVVEGGKLLLVVRETRDAAIGVVWTGSESNVWNYKQDNFWLDAATSFVAGDAVVFTADAGRTTLSVPDAVVTSGVTFQSGKYVLNGDGSLSGEGGLTVSKDADVTLNMKYSDYTGATVVNGGTLTVPNCYDGGQKSALGAATPAEGNLQLNGGTLVLARDNMGTDRIITLTDTATIRIDQSNSALTLKGQVKGTGYLVKDGPGTLNFNYGDTNNFAGLIVKQGKVAQGSWNSTFGRSGSPMVLAGGEVHQIDQNSSSTTPVFDHRVTVVEGTTNRILGSSRGKVNGTFYGTGNLTIETRYVRCDVGANLSNFEGTLTAVGRQFRLMTNVTNMRKGRLQVGAGTYIAFYGAGSGSEASATMQIGSLLGTATDGVLGGGSSTYQIGYLNEDTQFSGLLTANSIVKVGTGKLKLVTAGHTSPITIQGGTVELQNSAATAMTSGLITVASGGTLQGTGMATAVTATKGGTVTGGVNGNVGVLRLSGALRMNSGSRLLVKLGKTSGNDRFTVKGSIIHTKDTIVLSIPEGRVLKEGDELLLFTSGFASATGTPLIKAEAADGSVYEFDLSTLNTDGKIRVTTAITGIESLLNGNRQLSVYSLDGVMLRGNVAASDALASLPSGIYVVTYRTANGKAFSSKVAK